MNQNSLKDLQLGLSDVSRLLLPFLVIWLLGAIGLGWLVKSLLFLFGLLLIAPIVAFVGFRWWLKRNVIQAECPVCGFESVNLKSAEFRCPNCNDPLKVEGTRFVRLVPSGTIDVSAVEIETNATDIPMRRIEEQ
ncbi:hypothetical protein JOY44_03055 [Phormidium sp. CLA17]|uniref:hypothetical protein n=1 Tax=Leptolyngbya sp. Cla-17 TaxID=2803751 RepID=UPI00149099F4|nr:hypothetical protein [Leptolyngbya sp. Cla-17]MBM0740604.1 hypothetical protein [Leptolyngbya sp. Cla-17]